VLDYSQFPLGVITLPFTLVAGKPVLALTQQPNPRCWITIRNDITSAAGSYLYVGFNQAPSILTAAWQIPVGGSITLDTRVPQDDIWLAGTISNVLGVISYINYPIPNGT
jgi:hypothetical protein